MERIAFILGDRFFYWSPILLTLAAAAAACAFLALYLGRSGNLTAAFAAVPLALGLSLAAARMVHWYCRTQSYDSLTAAMTDYSSGGYALVGAFAGCFLAAAFTRLVRLHRNLPEMLDCMSLAGAGGIALGRLASFFNSSDRGQLVETVRTMPWVYPVTNAVSGAQEYRLATFLLQSMTAGVIFLVLLVFYLTGKRRRRDGDVTLIFLLCYCASQILLDSTRYDSLYFRSNGFVSIVQVLSLGTVVLVAVVFSARLVRARGFRRWQLGLWGIMTALLGCVGYMEYHVQRHGNQALFSYSFMGVCLALVTTLALVIRHMAQKPMGRYVKT